MNQPFDSIKPGRQIICTKLILPDLKMPKVNGKEMLLKIRENPGTKKIPVEILTSFKEDPDIEQCFDWGANSYVVKPVEFDEFEKTISIPGLYWIFNKSANSIK